MLSKTKEVDPKNMKIREIRETDVTYVHKNYSRMTAVEIGAKKGLAFFQVNGIVVGLRKAGLLEKKRHNSINVLNAGIEKIKKSL